MSALHISAPLNFAVGKLSLFPVQQLLVRGSNDVVISQVELFTLKYTNMQNTPNGTVVNMAIIP